MNSIIGKLHNSKILTSVNIPLSLSLLQISRGFAKPAEKPAKDNTPKVKQSKGGKAKSGGPRGKVEKRNNSEEDSMMEAIEKFVSVSDRASKLKLDFTDEEKKEHERIAKEYAKQNQIRHNKFEKDLTTKIYLQTDALNALPEQLQIAASVIDHEPPPSDRPMAVWATPPIKGFNVRDYVGKSNEEDEFGDEEEESDEGDVDNIDDEEDDNEDNTIGKKD